MLRRIHWKRTLANVALFIYILLIFYALTNDNVRCNRYEMSPEYIDPLFQDAEKCQIDLTSLKPNHVDIFANPSLEEIEKTNPMVEAGGKWQPKSCQPRQKVAIIVPYRDRMHHLLLLLDTLHPFLQKQRISYRIFVIDQSGNEKFNRGRLLNIGVVEALKYEHFDCFVFQDVDLLPEHGKNIYYCDEHVRHLASAIDEMRYHVMYYNYAGGVVSINRENMFRMNGYANDYWGWGNEDDDFSARSKELGLCLTRPPVHIGRYKMIRHTKQWRADNGYDLFMTWKSRWKTDGLGNIEKKYTVSKINEYPLYTHIIVDIGKPPDKPPIVESSEKESLVWFLQYFFP